MHSGAKLARALRSISPKFFDGDVARRVGLAGLLTPLRSGGGLSELQFLYAGRRRNRFTPGGGPKCFYVGEDEDVGSAEVKREALLGSFAKKSTDAAAVFWARAVLPNAVLDITDSSVLATLGTTDAEVHDPDWRELPAPSPAEMLGLAAFHDGRFAAIKYWSVRVRAVGKSGFCFCIFKTRVLSPCSVAFSSSSLRLSEKWP